ncbi:MAG: PD-(D/E)XK nuclease family protein, partial [Hungatella sp.]
TRTRLAGIRVLFFAGVNEGIVPSGKKGGSILTDNERLLLRTCQMELAPTAREDGFMQRFYLYLLMTKPSSRLILSFAAFTSAGKSQRPSSLIGDIRRLFPQIQIQDEESGKRIGSVTEGKRMLIQGLREYEKYPDDRQFLELFRWFKQSPEYEKQLEQLVDAAFYIYEEKGIGKAAARALYGTILQGSVTRLERYAACAYAHFLSYGLELMERQEYQLASVDMGNLFHESIDLCFREIRNLGKRPEEVTEEERKALVKDCVEKVTQEYGNTILQSSARNRYLAGKIERITDRTIWALLEQLKQGDFTPAGFEVSFSAIDNLKAMKIALSEEEALHLRGRIDRLDLCEEGDHVYVKIIDYKSGSTRFELAALYYGLQLQLVVYMDAVMEMQERRYPDKKVVPAGIFYYNIKDPMVEKEETISEDEVEVKILEQLKMNGLVNSDLESIRHLDREIQQKSQVIPVSMKNGTIQEHYSSVASENRFQVLRHFVRNRLKQSGQEILAGRTEIAPYKMGTQTACDYCPYHA